MNKEVNISEYQQLLETMLKKLGQEITIIARPDFNISNIDPLDEYIQALNSYYYRSFNDHYLPQFMSLINNEISGLLKLRRQEDRLQQDIMTSLQRYATLYNQVKTIGTLLSKSRHDINYKLIAATRYQSMSNADFLLALKQLLDNLQLFRLFTLDLLQLAEDESFMTALHQLPDFNPLTQLVLKMDFNSQNDLKTVNSLLSHFKFLSSLLPNNSREFWENAENAVSLIESIIFSMDDYIKKAPVPINHFYNKYIKNQLLVYMQLLKPGSKNAVKTNFALARDFNDWLVALTTILDRSIYYSINTNTMLPHLTTVISLPAEYARLLNTRVTDCLEEVSRLYEDFYQASEPDFAYFYQQTTAIIEKHTDKLATTDWRSSSPDSSPLPYWQRRLNLELSSLTYLMAFFKEKHLHARQVMDQYLEVVNLLDTYLNLLANIRSDLERLMAPRNISRAWKDIYIKIERIPLETGKVFPSQYQSLLQSNLIQMKTSEAETNTILHEEGDLFIIKVDDQTSVEIPNLILAD